MLIHFKTHTIRNKRMEYNAVRILVLQTCVFDMPGCGHQKDHWSNAPTL